MISFLKYREDEKMGSAEELLLLVSEAETGELLEESERVDNKTWTSKQEKQLIVQRIDSM